MRTKKNARSISNSCAYVYLFSFIGRCDTKQCTTHPGNESVVATGLAKNDAEFIQRLAQVDALLNQRDLERLAKRHFPGRPLSHLSVHIDYSSYPSQRSVTIPKLEAKPIIGVDGRRATPVWVSVLQGRATSKELLVYVEGL